MIDNNLFPFSDHELVTAEEERLPDPELLRPPYKLGDVFPGVKRGRLACLVVFGDP